MPIDQKQVIDALQNVPADRWQDVLRFLRSMQSSESETSMETPIRTASDMAESGLVGSWAERDDLGDSQEFARSLRNQAEHRGGVPDAL